MQLALVSGCAQVPPKAAPDEMASGELAGPIDCTAASIDLQVDGRLYRMTRNPYQYEAKITARSELLYGSQGHPDWSGAASSEDGAVVYLFGGAAKLPGELDEPTVRVKLPGSLERGSRTARIAITSIGGVGDRVAGRFRAELSAGLNGTPTVVSGTFCLGRDPDRNRP